MSYLIFPTRTAARTRSRNAYAPLRPDDEPDTGAVTVALWSSLHHPSDGRTALVIPETPEGAGLGISQEDYDGLLSEAERAALIPDLPAEWTIDAI
ncbi:MAG: hypothetical protein DI549_10735 [Ancylobacter novellus]|uniref:Uncharacterized protein n=1 Tax=Ancylobacter novellus TaxID=921 RepID=A0A2W5R1Z7_ANCNO|nr:MAG: hypothetical protein DI549_10735 [Ancylobacter novellus]